MNMPAPKSLARSPERNTDMTNTDKDREEQEYRRRYQEASERKRREREENDDKDETPRVPGRYRAYRGPQDL